MDLSMYREKIKNLDVNEQVLRDLYLRDLALGKLQGPMTGYASLDKPWLKYFEAEKMGTPIPKMNLYDFLFECNKDYLNEVALEYFGTKITFKQLFENIDRCASALKAKGLKKGDIVSMALPNCPEALYLFYATNKLGIILNSFDPRSKGKDVLKYIKETDSKYYFVLDMCLESENVVDEINTIDGLNVIKVSPANSMNPLIKTLYKLKNGKSKKLEYNFILQEYGDFIKDGKDIKTDSEAYEKEYPAVILRTGGTTGTSKGVVLTNDSYNAMIRSNMTAGIDYQRKQSFLDILPPFISYGLCNSVHIPLCLGVKVILIPNFEANGIPDLLMKYRPNHICASPVHWEHLLKNKKAEKFDFSFLITAGSGGDSMSRQLQEEINKFLKDHHCKYGISQGYGMTEVSSAVCYAKSNEVNRPGSVGVPFVENVVGIFDPETGEEMQYNERGELCILTESRMKGYYKESSKEDSTVLKTHEDGKIWVHTGDLGHVTEDGIVYIDDRIKRIINRRGFKIFPSVLERLALENENIKDCVVVGIPDEKERHLPICNIVLKENALENQTEEEIVTQLINSCAANLFDYYMPSHFFVLDQIPLTSISKVNYRELEKIDTEMIAKKSDHPKVYKKQS